jgi:hypothetical protein
MGSFPLERHDRPIAAGRHRLSFNGLIETAGPLLGTEDEFETLNIAQQYIDTQRGRSVQAQATEIVRQATLLAIDFSDIQSCTSTPDIDEPEK